MRVTLVLSEFYPIAEGYLAEYELKKYSLK
jgi:hypothetical protein